jgi:hypothetical protein
MLTSKSGDDSHDSNRCIQCNNDTNPVLEISVVLSIEKYPHFGHLGSRVEENTDFSSQHERQDNHVGSKALSDILP